MGSRNLKTASKRRRKKVNTGSFKPGPDPRRHNFTTRERKRGYLSAVSGVGKCNNPQISAWVFRRVRAYYRMS